MIEIKHKNTGKVIYTVDADSLEGAYLRYANLYGADLEGADLYGADLEGANLEGADLRGADLRGADLEGADLEGANLRGADLEGADLRYANLEGANLEGANLEGANLEGANLRGANLRGANLYFCKGILSFTGEKHLLIYFRYQNKYYIKIGCMTYECKDWIKNYKKIGKENNFIRDTLKKYGFNPVVTTIGSLNQVSLQDSAKLHSKELDYLKNLGKENNYGANTELYGDVIKLFSKYEL